MTQHNKTVTDTLIHLKFGVLKIQKSRAHRGDLKCTTWAEKLLKSHELGLTL